jgi:hypothetical protein
MIRPVMARRAGLVVRPVRASDGLQGLRTFWRIPYQMHDGARPNRQSVDQRGQEQDPTGPDA